MENTYGLYDLLKLKRINSFTFLGKNFKTSWDRVYGGQVLAQSLHAANQTILNNRYIHSLHGYFILAGDIKVLTQEGLLLIKKAKRFLCLAHHFKLMKKD